MKYFILNKDNNKIVSGLLVDEEFSLYNNVFYFETTDINIAYRYKEKVNIVYSYDGPFTVIAE